ncbi:MAG: hypothetical protein WKG06_48035 [Segetibacter sp.]
MLQIFIGAHIIKVSQLWKIINLMFLKMQTDELYLQKPAYEINLNICRSSLENASDEILLANWKLFLSKNSYYNVIE